MCTFAVLYRARSSNIVVAIEDMDKNKSESAGPTSSDPKSEKKEPLSLEELLAKKKAEELARSKVSEFYVTPITSGVIGFVFEYSAVRFSRCF